LATKGEIKIISKPRMVRLDKLHLQYLPICCPLWLYPGVDPMRVSRTHHVSLLKHIIKHGMDWKKLKRTKYVRERRHRYDIGMVKWLDSHVRWHIKNRWKIYRSLKERGWSKKKAKEKPIIVLRKPFIETRFNWESGFLKGYEVWDGFGRTSAAYVLGWKAIPVVFGEDMKPGACEFNRGYRKIKGKYGN